MRSSLNGVMEDVNVDEAPEDVDTDFVDVDNAHEALKIVKVLFSMCTHAKDLEYTIYPCEIPLA